MDALIFKIATLIINPIIATLVALAVLIFLWGVIQYFFNTDNEEVRENASRHMLYGVIGIFIMVSVFGITRIIMNTLDVPQEYRPTTIPRN